MKNAAENLRKRGGGRNFYRRRKRGIVFRGKIGVLSKKYVRKRRVLPRKGRKAERKKIRGDFTKFKALFV